jgi:Family of unknown function (DUF6869)
MHQRRHGQQTDVNSMLRQDEELAVAWIRRYELIHRETDQSPAAKSLFWAFQKLDEYCEREPEKAFALILAIARLTDDQFVLDNLAAGPLESLLVRNGSVVIDDIELEVSHNAKLRELLQGVWHNLIDETIWQRVERSRSRTS